MEDEMANLLQQGGQRFQQGGQRLQRGGRRGGCAQRGGASLEGEPVSTVQGNDAMSSLGFSLYGGKRSRRFKGKPKSKSGKSRRKSRGKSRSKVFPNGLFGKLMR
jgi:hypothetical protein